MDARARGVSARLALPELPRNGLEVGSGRPWRVQGRGHLKDHPQTTADDVAKGLNANRDTIATRLSRTAKEGEVTKAARGYAAKQSNRLAARSRCCPVRASSSSKPPCAQDLQQDIRRPPLRPRRPGPKQVDTVGVDIDALRPPRSAYMSAHAASRAACFGAREALAGLSSANEPRRLSRIPAGVLV
jgi:hypothetical protein